MDSLNCNGCGRCFADCPFSAVVVEPRTDGRRGPGLARVLPELCVSCGICAGACPSSTPFRSIAELVTGIDMPQRPLDTVRAELERILATRSAGPRIIVFGCDRAADVGALARADTGAVSLLCTGQLPPSFVEYALRGGANGVLVTGCALEGCYFRQGNTLLEERLAGEREPHLRTSVPRERLRVVWVDTGELDRLDAELAAFRAALAGLAGARTGRIAPPKRKEASGG